jgi:S1-C subfamily serine protease
MSNSSGLAWSVAKGTLAALRLPDDIPGAGQGLRLVPFTAAVSSGARGGPLVGSQSIRLGIVTRGIARGPGEHPLGLSSRRPARR